MKNNSQASSTIVIDNGNGIIKIDFNHKKDNLKPFTYPSMYAFISQVCRINHPKYANQKIEKCIAQELPTSKKNIFKVKYPLNRGIIENWDQMELLWEHGYSTLKVKSKQFSVLLTEAHLTPINQTKKMSSLFFEKYEVPSLYVASQGVLSLFGCGKQTGIVLESGEGLTQVIPIFEGYGLKNACLKANIAGKDVTEHLQKLFKKKGVNFDTSIELEIVRQIKQKYCEVRHESAQESKESMKAVEKYTLPDGKTITISNNEKFASQILFSANKLNLEMQSFPQLLCESISKVNIDVRQVLYENVVLSGGNTMFQGFIQRMLKEMKKILPEGVRNKICARDDRQLLCWQGGNIFTQLSTFEKMMISKAEFEQKGENVLMERRMM